LTEDAERLPAAERLLHYRFARPELLREALTHRSASGGRLARRGNRSNERLEFLGDRVLGLIMAEWLAERFPNEQEGDLGLRFASLVSREALSDIAGALGMTPLLSVNGTPPTPNSLADALEATLAAIYLDGGLDQARDFVRRLWNDRLTRQLQPPADPKTTLQMWLQGRGKPLPEYTVIANEGPPHAPKFIVTVTGADQQGQGEAGTKRAAERAAAAALLERLTCGR
jgi:ribonuclease-3